MSLKGDKMSRKKILEGEGWKKYRAIKADQPGESVYQISIKGRDLVKNAEVLRRGMHEEGIQRILKKSRLRRINKFYQSKDAFVVNNIVGTISSDHVRCEDGYVYLSPEFKVYIIDGQHRLWGFDAEYNEEGIDFEVFLVFVVNANNEKMARLFYKINKEQKKINPSLAYDLLEVVDEEGLDKEISEVIKRMDREEKSPFYGLIKMNETETGKKITLVNMMTVIKDFLKTDIGSRFFQNEEHVKKGLLFDFFVNYFLGVKKVFSETWEEEESILLKAVGIGAFSNLTNDVFNEFVRTKGQRMPAEEEIAEILEPAQGFNFNDDEIRGLGGKKGQKVLAGLIRQELGWGFSENLD